MQTLRQKFRMLELEWKIILVAALLFLALIIPVQKVMTARVNATLQESVDSNLDTLLHQGYQVADSSSKEAWLYSMERNRQWQAMIPILLEEQKATLILFSVLLFVTLLLFAIWTLRRLTRPLKNLAMAADAIGRGETPHIPKVAGGALGRLENAMDSMQGELKTLREQLVAQGMEQAWRDIARVMAHEIKNPLTPIRLTLDRIEERLSQNQTLPPEELSRFTGRIVSQVEQLERLVLAFGSFAKEPEVRLRPMELRETIASAAEPMQDAITLKIEGHASAIVDPYLLSQVVLNIAKNASEAGATELHITLTEERKCAFVLLRDNGPGVPPDRLRNLFIPYSTTKAGGNGLGLPIVKRLLTAMNGSVHLESQIGQGLSIHIRLPRPKGETA